ERMDVGLAKASPPHAYHIEPNEIRERPLHHPERDHVGAHPAHADHHCTLADAHELADRSLDAEHGEISDVDLTAPYDVVGQRHIIADRAIMSHVGADHEEAAITHLAQPAAVLGADIHGNACADVAIRSDHQPGRAAAILHQLRRGAERGERIDHAPWAD